MRIFFASTLYNMEKSLFIDTLESLDHEVIHHGWKFDDTYTRAWLDWQKLATNTKMLQLLNEEHIKQPIDLFLSYMSNRTTYGGVIKTIKESLNIPCVNFSWDDRLKVDQQSEIAKYYDLCWTTDKKVRWMGKDISSVEAYGLMDAFAIYLPAGANPQLFYPNSDIEKKYPISFIGSGGGGYKYRDRALMKLKNIFGNDLCLFGSIADNKVSTEEYINIIRSSKINLGFSGVSGAQEICSPWQCIKGRDFEVPMAGGFYLTEHNPDIEEIYNIGTEIDTYKSFDDLVSKIKHYLKEDSKREEIALIGCDKAHNDHTMQNRFEVLFGELGLIND